MTRSTELAVGVRFVIGPAGTGKTALCAREISAEMARQPLGGALLWITPEQATFNAERLLLTGGGVSSEGRGTFRAQVLSFRRLAMLIGHEAGAVPTEGRPMDEVARLVLLEELVRKHRTELEVFASVVDRQGFVRRLDAMLRELRQHGHTGASLRAMSGRLDGATAAKLSDLAILLDAWSQVVDAQDLWDWERVMHAAVRQMADSPLVTGEGGAQVWVDGFSAMTGLEIWLLAALGRHAQRVTVTLLADPDSPGLTQMRDAEEGLFARTERLHRQLVDAFRAQGVAIEGNMALRQAHRFASDGLGRLERWLCGQDAGAGGAEGVEILEAGDPETEVRAAAQAIREMVIDGGLRYRQIGVIVPDLEGYADALRRNFSEHGIPHFLDQRRGMAHHPVVELVRSATAIARGTWAQDDVLLYLKTGLAGVSETDVSLVENYLIEHGVTRVPWATPWEWVQRNARDDDPYVPASAHAVLQRANEVRGKVWEDLRAWVEGNAKRASRNTKHDAAELAGGLRELLTRLAVERQVEQWAGQARQRGDAELAQFHEQAWRQTADLLATLERILTGKERTLEEFEGLLSTGLESLTLGLVPPTVDQVLVSSVMRSRTPELDVVIVLGAVEGWMPKVPEEDPILSDEQRRRINDASGEQGGVEAGADRQLLEMPFFDYVALTRAGRRLIVSHPLADRSGRALGRSRYIGGIAELLGIEARKVDGSGRRSVARMGTVDDVLAGVMEWIAAEKHKTQNTKYETGGVAASMEALYQWVVSSEDLRPARELVWPGVRGAEDPRLSAALRARLYPPRRPMELSVSQLEQFAACPLQYFLHYTLALAPRKLFEIDVMDVGSLYHKALEKLYGRIIAGALPWPECPEGALGAALQQAIDAAVTELHGEMALRTPGYDKTRTRARRVLGTAVEADRRRARAGTMRPRGVEVRFKRGGAGPAKAGERIVSLPVLAVTTPGGRRVEVNGKIDRVDAAEEGRGAEVTVIDYKSSADKRLSLAEVAAGLALQLPAYGVVMQENGREALAALYVALGLKPDTTRPGDAVAAPGSDEFYRQFRPRGMVDWSRADRLDKALSPERTEGARSDWYVLNRKKDGDIAASSDLLEREEFAKVLEYARWMIGALADQLAEGVIAPRPYRAGGRTPCDNCEYLSVCSFDQARGEFRVIERLKREEALTAMRHAMVGKSSVNE